MFLKPTLIAEDVTGIDLTHLKTLGITGFIFDLDNTIMAPNTAALDEPIETWLNQIQQQGYRCVVVSNNPHADYLKRAEAVLRFPCLGNAGKPRRGSLRKALEILDLPPHQVAVVGDRPLTDIWGGYRLGAHTILVKSLSHRTEPPVIQWLRRLEWLTVRLECALISDSRLGKPV